MKKSVLILLFFIVFSAFAKEKNEAVLKLNNTQIVSLGNDTSKMIINEQGDTIYLVKRKFTAILLTVLTGPLGGHRLYLGTKPIVPVVYAVTLGGGLLVIPILDLFAIIFTKDLSKFENNDKVLMWINGEEDEDFDEEWLLEVPYNSSVE